MLAMGLLILAVISRFIPHVPNFTPVIALALFGGVYLNKRLALLLPLVSLGITDCFLGIHQTMLFTWVSILLISLIGLLLRKKKNFKTIFYSSISSAVLFFLITNFGVWLATDLYPQTLAGLVRCFVLAIPFFRNTLISTLIYTFLLFGVYEFIAARVKKTRFSYVL